MKKKKQKQPWNNLFLNNVISLLPGSSEKMRVQGVVFYKMLYIGKELLHLYFILLYEKKMLILELLSWQFINYPSMLS